MTSLQSLLLRMTGYLLSSLLVLLVAAASAQAQTNPKVVVHRSASCDCCTSWENHLSAAGFVITDVVSNNLDAVKSSNGIIPELESCHTALVEGYVIEGHVPAAAIRRLLTEHLSIRGLTAPGMPMGSPGMDDDGITPEPYAVLAIDKNSHTTVYEHYPQTNE
ncbi:DUF411 domain-containing protein [Synechococcus sp. RS9916]|uniref:DUF411 domain-containing protein n=1 Tax=Synechococcus sp. RS9916 TaxID=221359 RepID=UPI0000E53CF4|nr:DUF411 domain-containing protein [Synechococcus sp. RS9916]EAU73188.1 hypothetical protein RS9916_26794 [Synechococcus sp. RS9916]